MTLSSLILSQDWPEIGVLECILSGLRIAVEIEGEPQQARAKLSKSKIDAVLVDYDLNGAAGFLRNLQDHADPASNAPLVIVSGSCSVHKLETTGASFVFEKPVSVEQAVRTLSAARNMIVERRLRYHRHDLRVPVALSCGTRKHVGASLTNLSQGGLRVQVPQTAAINGPVQIAFELPGSGQAVKARGEVAWMDNHGNAGIRFVQISPRLQRDLRLWLEQRFFAH